VLHIIQQLAPVRGVNHHHHHHRCEVSQHVYACVMVVNTDAVDADDCVAMLVIIIMVTASRPSHSHLPSFTAHKKQSAAATHLRKD
jgi:hypothetical protein